MSKEISEDLIKADGHYENVFLNANTNKDGSRDTRHVTCRMLDQLQIESLYQSDGFARRIIDLPAEEMVRAGYCIEGIEDDGNVIAELENISTMQKICDALRWNALYGGSMIVMLINDGGLLEDPLNVKAAKSIEQLRVYDKTQITRHRKYSDPNDRRFGETEIYNISPINSMPYLVHESRCLVFDGLPVPARVRDQNDGWGASKLQQCYDQLVNFGMSHYWTVRLLERAQQAVHSINDLANTLRQKGGEETVKKRIDLVDMARSINNTVVIDALESYELKSTSFASIPEIIDRLGLALTAVSDGIPESLLFGRQQGGLNSTGKSDLENWYAKIAQYQNTILLPKLDKLITIQLKIMNKYVDDYLIKFHPLSVPSKKDIAETEYKKAQTYEILYNIQSLSSGEIRSMLPDDGYDIEEDAELPENPEEDANYAEALNNVKAANGKEEEIQ